MKKLLYLMVSVVLINAMSFTSKVFCYTHIGHCVGDDCGNKDNRYLGNHCRPGATTVTIWNRTGREIGLEVNYAVCSNDKTTLENKQYFCNGTGLCHINEITVWLTEDKKINTSTTNFRSIQVTYDEKKKKLIIKEIPQHYVTRDGYLDTGED